MSPDPLALNLANHSLGSTSDLGRWLTGVGTAVGGSDEVIAFRLPEFAALQASVLDLFEASIGGGPFPAAAVERLNEVSARVPRVSRFQGGEARQAPLGSNPTSLLLAEIAWSAIDLLGGADRERLRRCDACGRFFIATRADRRWCSPACGNRTRVARHHARRKAERG